MRIIIESATTVYMQTGYRLRCSDKEFVATNMADALAIAERHMTEELSGASCCAVTKSGLEAACCPVAESEPEAEQETPTP